MGTSRRASVLLAAVFLSACGTLLGINADSNGPPPADTGDAGAEADGGPIRATGGPCVFDDPASKLDDVCGFGP